MIDANTLYTQLSEGLVKVTFTKRDGTTRTMVCTLSEAYMPPQPHREMFSPDVDVTPSDVFAVWDVEANGWRSFRIDSIISVEAA